MRKQAYFGLALAVFTGALILASLFLGNQTGGTYENASASIQPSVASGSTVRDPKEVLFCDVLGDRVTRQECAYFEEILQKLETGEAALDVPPDMVRGEDATVSFVVSRDIMAAPLEVILGSKTDEQFSLKVGRRMAALLQGDGFKIEPAGLQHRDLFIGKGARWDWRVTPLKARRYRLMMSAYVVVPAADGSQKENLLKTVEKVVPVRVTWPQWFDDVVTDSESWIKKGTNWIYALIALLTAIGLLIAFFRKKKAP